MPFYTWKCSDGHVTEKFRTISKLTETVQCSFNNPRCRKKAHLFLQTAPGNSNPNRIWLGSEVHGKRVNSDEVRQDIEDACLKEEHPTIPKDTLEAIEKTRLGVNRKAAGFAN